MMKSLAFVLFCLLISPAAALAAEPPTQTYETLVAAAKRGDKPIDWTAIRLAYTKSKNYDFSGATFTVDQTEMMKAIVAKDYTTATKKANLILDKFYGNMFAHRGLEIVYGATGNAKLEKQYHDNVGGIFMSITNDSENNSKEKPFVAVTINEEYQMLTMLGLELKEQFFIANDQNGHSYDLMRSKNAKGKEFDVYFQIDEIVAEENRKAETYRQKAKE